MTRHAAARLTLGPILYHWPAETKRDFYFRIADEAPLDVVYLGEVVCSKRAPFFDPYIPEVAERLAAAGKQVVYSTLALVMTERELDGVRALAGTDGLLVEANDVSALPRLVGRPHVVGPFINVYNGDTLRVLARRGAMRAALPNELAADAIAALAESAGGVELEVQVFGRLPLALSARCYHARSRGLAKDGCQYVCGEDDDGLALSTVAGSPFLAVNGIQLLSYRMYNLVRELAGLAGIGVTHFRLWPQAVDMVAVARVFRSALDRRLDPGEAESRLGALLHDIPFANGFYHQREGVAFVSARASE